MPDSVTPWIAAHQASLSMRFSRQGYWNGLPFPSPGIFPTQGSNPGLLHCRQILYPLSYKGSPLPLNHHPNTITTLWPFPQHTHTNRCLHSSTMESKEAKKAACMSTNPLIDWRRSWIWASSGRWWRAGESGVLQSRRSQRAGHNWASTQQPPPRLRAHCPNKLITCKYWGVRIKTGELRRVENTDPSFKEFIRFMGR